MGLVSHFVILYYNLNNMVYKTKCCTVNELNRNDCVDGCIAKFKVVSDVQPWAPINRNLVYFKKNCSCFINNFG